MNKKKKVERHQRLSDTEFERQFRECELPPQDFTHEAHLRLAWIHIRRYGIKRAEINVPEQLRAYVASVGATHKYNATLTIAAIKAVYHFVCRSRVEKFLDFILEFPRLKYNFKDLMDAHYGFDIYGSEEAKQQFLEPDLLPFD